MSSKLFSTGVKWQSQFTIILMVLALSLSSNLFPQSISVKMYFDMKWRLVGPFRGGWGTVCDGIPDSTNVYYFGGAGGGVWKTIDAGNTWQPLMQNESASAVGALTIAPSNPNIIYVGTGQVAWRYDILDGDGVYKTEDGGKTWKNIGLKETKYIGRILVHPQFIKVLMAVNIGQNFLQTVYLFFPVGLGWQLQKKPKEKLFMQA